ncbi:ferredoxin:protochlorophyllide reductase (ATP-dependent) subunit B [Lutimaribacter saemankumensis]|uniref:Light-independent protochlorophyllide reductase subunit B n=1 Tax=Lutimaribacter saemankumensis TaxID=490829 RepID=A0A1G8SJR8_9RHOB|nr:ferredoxin:protochlorophyllide reductase (ATP-dependent) subunit B [Lutimaribacter saemankumensis]SDJ29457.1 light-independent protochlorophyllide reductase subunit B [Lutimaribacter saemankumensis]
MKLTVWTYEGPPHVGAMRVATAMKDLHYVLHAPQGDTYADLLFTMIERRNHRPPVTYTTFQARDLGADTANLFKSAAQDAYDRFQPQAIIVGASCTAELIQDDPGGMAETMGLPIPVIPLELPSYQRKENFGADETFYQIVKALAKPVEKSAHPTANLIGPTALGFRHRDDITEITALLGDMGIGVNVVAPYNATPHDITRMGAAHFNVLMYPETAETAARWMERELALPYTKTVPIGVGATRDFVAEVAAITGRNTVLDESRLRLPWYSASVDSTYLTGKRVFLFGDGTHVAAAARIARDEMGFEVVGMGCYNREQARTIRTLAKDYGVPALITDDYLEVEKTIEDLAPEMILGTQMERHIGKRLGIPCAVISAPVHVQDFPARYSPQMGIEGANVIFDTWVHPLVMGLEEHLLHMFRDDFEFHDDAGASHHGHKAKLRDLDAPAATDGPEMAPAPVESSVEVVWLPAAEKELKKIPFFVRGKARRNTETFAAERGVSEISVDTLYEAKAHYAR